jgi:hypothetical protein
MLYFLPLLLFFSAYAIYVLIANKWEKMNISLRILGSLIFVLIMTGNLIYYYQNYLPYKSPVSGFETGVKQLIQKYPDKKFRVYDYNWHCSYHSQPASFLLQKENKIDSINGIPIGFACDKEYTPNLPQIGQLNTVPIYELTTEKDLKSNKHWVDVTQKGMYDDLMKWSKTEKLHSNFTF